MTSAQLKKNFNGKLGSLKKILNIWSSRDISVYGKINIVKTLTLSKLMFVCSVLDTPNDEQIGLPLRGRPILLSLV